MLFKILHGDESRISLDITPFHEGWAYVTHSGNFYIDMNIGTVEVPNNQRIKLNAKDAETLGTYTADEFILKADIDDVLAKASISSSQVSHGDSLLSSILDMYILSIDYDALAFDTTEIVGGTETNTSSVLGQAILGQLVLA